MSDGDHHHRDERGHRDQGQRGQPRSAGGRHAQTHQQRVDPWGPVQTSARSHAQPPRAASPQHGKEPPQTVAGSNAVAASSSAPTTGEWEKSNCA